MSSPRRWSRIIIHVDMDAFFASVEQRDFKELRGQPVVITNGERGSCIITCSYEARAYGITTGMRLPEAKRLCPHLVQAPTRPRLYAEISGHIMQILSDITPDIEIFSVDEAFLELTHCRHLYHSPKVVGRMIKDRIWNEEGLACTVGISGDKTTAKYASKHGKPDGLLIIPPWQSRDTLAPLPVRELCGIAKGVEQFLAQYGVFVCGDMHKIPISVLAKRFGSLGRRIWKMCQGEDPAPLYQSIPDPKSMGHGKILPPNTRDPVMVRRCLRHMAHKLMKRMRRHALEAQHFSVGIRTSEEWVHRVYHTALPTADGNLLAQFTEHLLQSRWQGDGVFQCQITALDPRAEHLQGDLFETDFPTCERLNKVTDAIRDRFGNKSIVTASCLEDLETPNVIAPAWRPDGARNSIL